MHAIVNMNIKNDKQTKTDNREQFDKVHFIISNLNFQAEFKYLQNLIVRFLSQAFSNL
jgi:hypothetical protein